MLTSKIWRVRINWEDSGKAVGSTQHRLSTKQAQVLFISSQFSVFQGSHPAGSNVCTTCFQKSCYLPFMTLSHWCFYINVGKYLIKFWLSHCIFSSIMAGCWLVVVVVFLHSLPRALSNAWETLIFLINKWPYWTMLFLTLFHFRQADQIFPLGT